jgi:hypothetical protein
MLGLSERRPRRWWQLATGRQVRMDGVGARGPPPRDQAESMLRTEPEKRHFWPSSWVPGRPPSYGSACDHVVPEARHDLRQEPEPLALLVGDQDAEKRRLALRHGSAEQGKRKRVSRGVIDWRQVALSKLREDTYRGGPAIGPPSVRPHPNRSEMYCRLPLWSATTLLSAGRATWKSALRYWM